MSNSFDWFDPQEKIKELLAEVELLKAAIEAVGEWRDMDYCPFCYGNYPKHKPSCLRQAALGLSEDAWHENS